jgi:hypothetical protein
VLSRVPAHDGAVQMVSAGYIPQPPMPSQRPVWPHEAACSSTQMPCGSPRPVSTGQQVPAWASWLHETQEPVQATLQQTPSVQNPDAHSELLEHIAARGLGPQLPATHLTPATQSASELQVGRQAFVPGSQSNGAQMVAGPGRQRPSPSQTSMLATEAPWHCPGVQTVPAVYFAQAPAPSQVPSSAQLEAAALGQVLAARGAVPFGTNAHVPGDSGRLQTLQVSVQAVAQQTPSTQNPLAQSAVQPQAAPFALRAAPPSPVPAPQTSASGAASPPPSGRGPVE